MNNTPELCPATNFTDGTSFSQASLPPIYSVFSSLEEGLITLDPSLTVTYLNKAAAEIIHQAYSSDSKKGSSFLNCLPEYRRAIVKAVLEETLKGEVIKYEHAIHQGNGKVEWLDCQYYPIKDEEDNITGICIVFKSITTKKELQVAETRRKTVEAKLSESLIQFEAFMENAPITAWITDENGVMQYMNATFRKLFHFTKEDYGKYITELFPEELALLYLENNIKVLESGQPLEVFEKAYTEKGDTLIYKVFKFPISLSNKKCIAGWSVDITDHMNLQQDLADSLERYRYVNEATSDAIYDWDLSSKIIYRGSGFEKLFDYKDTTVTLRSWLQLIHPEDLPHVKKVLFESMRSTHVNKWNVEYRIKAAGGIYKYVVDKAFIIRENKKVLRAIGSMRDVTAQKQMDHQLLNQEKNKKREIIRSIIETQEKERRLLSVELHDNVNQILSSCKLMLECAKENKENAQMLTDKSYQSIQLAITELRRISHGLNPSAISDIGLIEVIEELVEKINATGKLAIAFQFDGRNPIQLKEEDKIAIYRIIQEQLNNIVKHSGATKACISLSLQFPTVFLTISDNGVGFDASKINKGIGLKNIRHRVEYYHGTIAIESNVNKGCAMKIELHISQTRLPGEFY